MNFFIFIYWNAKTQKNPLFYEVFDGMFF